MSIPIDGEILFDEVILKEKVANIVNEFRVKDPTVKSTIIDGPNAWYCQLVIYKPN